MSKKESFWMLRFLAVYLVRVCFIKGQIVFYRFCTSTLVNSFHLIIIVLMTQQFTIFLSYFFALP